MTKSIKFKIQEDHWTCRLLTDVKYEKTHPEIAESSGNVEFGKKRIDFKQSTFCLKYAIHELSHAYHGYLNLQDTNTIEWVDLTEILSTSNERNILLILEKSLKVYNKFSNIETNKLQREELLKLVTIAQKWI